MISLFLELLHNRIYLLIMLCVQIPLIKTPEKKAQAETSLMRVEGILVPLSLCPWLAQGRVTIQFTLLTIIPTTIRAALIYNQSA